MNAALSPNEALVAGLVAEGLTNAEIARARGVSLDTVAHQVASARRKLGARSRYELAKLSAPPLELPSTALEALGEEEREVVELAMRSERLRAIAAALGLPLDGVASRLRSAMRKLGLTRAQLARAVFVPDRASLDAQQAWLPPACASDLVLPLHGRGEQMRIAG